MKTSDLIQILQNSLDVNEELPAEIYDANFYIDLDILDILSLGADE